MAAPYAALWAKTNFSFLEGASHPGELVERAHALGLRALAVTDRDGVHGIVRAHVAAKACGLPLIVGSEVTIDDGSRIVLLAQDREGYAQLCGLLTKGRLRCDKGESRVRWDEVCAHAPGLIALWGGPAGMLDLDHVTGSLKDAFGDRLYALLARHLHAEGVPAEARLRVHAARHRIPLVATTEVLYHHRDRRPLQDVLTCIRHGTTLHGAGRLLKANAEHGLLTPTDFAARFHDDPAAVARTIEIADRCTFSMAELRYRYPLEALPDGTSAFEYLRSLAWDGAREKFSDGVPAAVQTQLEKELRLIEKLDYGGYFLTMRELVRYCGENGILCQGRGSAANSAVCYCLGVTAVDPIKMDLLFERFLSEERAEPPDIDLDIEHERREEVIQHVYEKYGKTHAAMVAVVISYRSRSAARDVGKALGMTETELGRLARMLDHYGGLTPEVLKLAELDPDAPLHRQLVELVAKLRGFPRHLSIHPGGFVLGHEPLDRLVPIENGTMADRTVIQWNKDDVEALGLFKVDLLGLGTLTHLRRCFALIERHEGLTHTMRSIPEDDPATYDMLCKGDTVGVFQVESRAQMAMLPRLRPLNYYDLVIQISVVRPGPITGGMVHPYLRRRHGLEDVIYPHELLEPVLKKTMGVPLFQEQVMKLAVVVADYTPGEADQLRRDMGAWRQDGRMEEHEERLITRMVANGIEPEFAKRVFKQIEGFGDYGFPEAHAASFAKLSYLGAYLRCHHLAAFACSLLNSLPMGFYSPETIVEDARRKDVEVRPIDILASTWDYALERADGGKLALRLGFRGIKGLGEADGARIMEEAAIAPFRDLEDFVYRTDLNERALVGLAEAGAFDPFGLERREALWAVRGLARTQPLPLELGPDRMGSFAQLSLFETVNWDGERAGASARAHPLEPLRTWLRDQGLPSARGVAGMAHGARVRYAGVVICRQRPSTGKDVTFMTLEDETGFVNLVIWPRVWQRFRVLARLERVLGVSGRLQVQHGVVHLVADRFWKPDLGPVLPVVGPSRDFH